MTKINELSTNSVALIKPLKKFSSKTIRMIAKTTSVMRLSTVVKDDEWTPTDHKSERKLLREMLNDVIERLTVVETALEETRFDLDVAYDDVEINDNVIQYYRKIASKEVTDTVIAAIVWDS
jgi:hypothetical protein